MWDHVDSVYLANISPITVCTHESLKHLKTLVNGICKPTHNWGAPYCMVVTSNRSVPVARQLTGFYDPVIKHGNGKYTI